MGVSWGELGTLNALQASRLKVLPTTAQQSLSVDEAAGTVTLSPLSGRTGTRGLRLTDSTGAEYWLEYRAATGQDAWLAASDNRYGLDSGVLVHRAGSFPDTSLLLDGTPGASAGWDADLSSALPVGTPVSLAGGQFTVVLQEVSEQGAVLKVVPTPPAAVPAPAPAPSVDGTGQVLAGGSAAAAADVAAGAAVVPAAAPAAPAAAASAAPATPPAALPEAATPHASPHATPALRAAADTSSRSGFVLYAAGALLAAAVLGGVHRVRRAGFSAR
jgi:hypothetical protein